MLSILNKLVVFAFSSLKQVQIKEEPVTIDENDVLKKTTSQKRKIKADTNTKAPTQKSKVSDTDSDADVKKVVKQVVDSDSDETDCKKQCKSKSDADMKSQKASGVKKPAQLSGKGVARGRGGHGCGNQVKKSNLPSETAVKTGSVEIKMDFGAQKGKKMQSKEENLEQIDQIKTSVDSNAPLTEDQKNAIILKWAADKPTLSALIHQEIKSMKKKKQVQKKKEEHANEIAWEKLKQKIDEMPKSSWKEVLEAASKEAVKPTVVESADSDTDLDGIPDNFEDADAGNNFFSDDDMIEDLPELKEDTQDWKVVRMSETDILIRCLFLDTPNQRYFPFTWIQIYGLCVPVQWQFNHDKQVKTTLKQEPKTKQTDGANDSSNQEESKLVLEVNVEWEDKVKREEVIVEVHPPHGGITEKSHTSTEKVDEKGTTENVLNTDAEENKQTGVSETCNADAASNGKKQDTDTGENDKTGVNEICNAGAEGDGKKQDTDAGENKQTGVDETCNADAEGNGMKQDTDAQENDKTGVGDTHNADASNGKKQDTDDSRNEKTRVDATDCDTPNAENHGKMDDADNTDDHKNEKAVGGNDNVSELAKKENNEETDQEQCEDDYEDVDEDGRESCDKSETEDSNTDTGSTFGENEEEESQDSESESDTSSEGDKREDCKGQAKIQVAEKAETHENEEEKETKKIRKQDTTQPRTHAEEKCEKKAGPLNEKAKKTS